MKRIPSAWSKFDQGSQKSPSWSMSLLWWATAVTGLLLMSVTIDQAVAALPQGLPESVDTVIKLPLIPRRELLRRREIAFDETFLFQGYGTHYVELWCGTPTPQKRTVSIDTGSDYTAFPCAGCQACGTHLDDPFQQSESATFRKTICSECYTGSCTSTEQECRFDAQYLEGDGWIAYEADDFCFVGDPSTSSSSSSTFDLFFGCQINVTGFFESQIEDGIMGVGNFTTSFWYQMYQAGIIQQRMFSVCYSPSLDLGSGIEGTESGILVLGGVDPNLHTTSMVYTSDATSIYDPFYHVTIRRVYLIESSSNRVVTLNASETDLNPSGGTIVDSGTTFSMFPYGLDDAFQQAWLDLMGSPFSENPVSIEELDSFPTILFQFNGDDASNVAQQRTSSLISNSVLAASLDPDHPFDVIVAFPPTHYMQYLYTDGYSSVLSFSQSDTNILGANFIMEYDVLFDLENDRIGWAPSECNYTLSMLTTQQTENTTTTTENATTTTTENTTTTTDNTTTTSENTTTTSENTTTASENATNTTENTTTTTENTNATTTETDNATISTENTTVTWNATIRGNSTANTGGGGANGTITVHPNKTSNNNIINSNNKTRTKAPASPVSSSLSGSTSVTLYTIHILLLAVVLLFLSLR